MFCQWIFLVEESIFLCVSKRGLVVPGGQLSVKWPPIYLWLYQLVRI